MSSPIDSRWETRFSAVIGAQWPQRNLPHQFTRLLRSWTRSDALVHARPLSEDEHFESQRRTLVPRRSLLETGNSHENPDFRMARRL